MCGVGAVTARDRNANILRMWREGASAGEIAQAVGMSKNTIRGVVSRARAKGADLDRRAKGPECLPAQRIAHLRFMAEWWAGVHLPWVRDDAKLAAAVAQLRGMGFAP